MADTKLERYYRTIPNIYNPKTNRFVNSLLQAWAGSDEEVVEQINNTKDQLFVETAESQYLDSLGGNVDVDRPLLIALADVFFRDLIVQMSYAPKQIRKTMYEVLDVFWGPTYSRANITSINTEPYDFGGVLGLNGQATFLNGSNKVSGAGTFFTSETSIGDFIKLTSDPDSAFAKIINIVDDENLVISGTYSGISATGLAKKYTPKTLIVKVDGLPSFTSILSPVHFVNTSSVTADELATALSADIPGASGSTVKTIHSFDKFVNLRTNTPGANGALQVIGGTANDVIAFPTEPVTINDLIRSTIIYEINPREIVFQLPNLVDKLRRTLKGAIHLHDDITGTILSIDNTEKTVTAILSQSVLENQLVSNVLAQGLEEFVITGNTRGLTTENGALFSFPVPLTEWVVDHGLGVQYVQLTAYDVSDKAIVPNEVLALSESQCILRFTIPQAGSVYVSSDISTFTFDTPETTWVISHGLDEAHVNVVAYNSLNQVIYPNKIISIDSNIINAEFLVPQTGRISVSKNFVHEQVSPALTWTMYHNLGLKNINATIYNGDGEAIWPNEIDASTQNTALAKFLSAESGWAAIGDTADDAVTIYFSSGEDLSKLSSSSGALDSPSIPSDVWNFIHSLNNQYPNISVYNILDQGIIPQSITANGINSLSAVFGSPVQGNIYLIANNSVFNFPVASTTWTVVHDIGVKYLNVTVYDDNSNVIYPQTITAINDITMSIEFGEAVAGRIALSNDFIHDQSIASDTWTVSHGIGSKYVSVTVYNSSDEVVIPESIVLNDINTLTITFASPVSGKAAVGDTATSKFVIINPNYPNSFIYDTANTFSITKTRAKLAQSIAAGDIVVALSVDDSSHIPDGEGYLVFNFGFPNQEQPIHYLSRPNNSTLILDPTHVFAHNHSAGEIMNILSATKAYVPRVKGQDYATYITGTREALAVVQSILDKIKAVGVVLRWDIQYPSYRFPCKNNS